MQLNFEDRSTPDSGNLFVSYCVQDDQKAAGLGFEFLGVAQDVEGNEIHVFRMAALETVQTPSLPNQR